LSAVADWDRDPWHLNTPGATIDLRTGIRRPHNRDDRITKMTNATPQGTPRRFIEFLAQVTGFDVELQAYLQRLAGYCLVGDPREECVDFLYGSGGNGKGTFIDALQHALGEYATTANADTFTASKVDRHPTDIAKLAGARLVVASEINEDREWDEARLKALTGRDVLTARKMRQDFFNFRAQFTLIIVGNHKPTLRTVDDAIRRRFHLVPFTVSISDEERDPDLKATLRSEADGILAWALEGCLQWQQLNGLHPPPVVLEATREYLAEEDAVGLWLEDCCERAAQYKEASSLLFESFRCWQENRGERLLSQNAFTKRLTAKHGFRRERNANERIIAGLRLTDRERADAIESLNRRKHSKKRWH
jgi:putative DNA primase/helicase